MKKLWVFGNSFTLLVERDTIRSLRMDEPTDHIDPNYFWTKMLQHELGASEYFNHGAPGFACNMVEMKKVYDQEKANFHDGDFIIFIPPDFNDMMEFNGYFKKLPPSEDAIVEAGQLCEIILGELNDSALKRNIHVVVISSMIPEYNWLVTNNIPAKYPAINFAKGIIGDIHGREHADSFPEDLKRYDSLLKSNHMIRSNHIVLANKMLNNYRYKTPIDMTTEFKEKILTDKTYEDKEFIEYEYYINPTLYVGQFDKLIDLVKQHIVTAGWKMSAD